MNWGDFLSFRKMITPVIIQVVFWLGVLFCVVYGFGQLLGGQGLMGLVYIIAGPIAVRIYCEMLILLFRIHDALQDIRSAKRM